MSVSKAVISGIAIRDAEKRFTSNDLAILNFTMNINEADETLLRVVMMGKMAENAEGLIKKGSKVTVESFDSGVLSVLFIVLITVLPNTGLAPFFSILISALPEADSHISIYPLRARLSNIAE